MKKTLTSIRFIVLFLFTIGFKMNLFSKQIYIPQDFPTIQQGINAASDGDSVIVAPGMWYEHLIISGKNMTLGSWFLTTGDTTYIQQTILNGSNTGRVISIDGISESARISGFTIKNGRSVAGSAIRITECVLQVDHVDVLNNTSECGSNQYAQGGGIACYSSTLTISDFSLSNNRALCTTPPVNPEGGAIYASASEIHLIKGKIIDNYANLGGGVYLTNSTGYFQRVEFEANEAPAPGAGICDFSSFLDVSECVFRGNMGDAIFAEYPGTLSITNCLFKENEGDLLHIGNVTLITIRNTTFTGNNFYNFFCFGTDEIQIFNSILWVNSEFQIACFNQQTQIYLINSLIKNGTAGISGTQNIHLTGSLLAVDPLFADTVNYLLSDNSPCIGAGLDSLGSYPYLSAPAYDLNLNPRPVPAGSPPDLGAIEHELGSPVAEVVTFKPDENEVRIYQHNRGIYSIQGNDMKEILVYNTTGKLISISEANGSAHAEVNFNGNPAGIYFFRIVLNNQSSIVRKILHH